MAKNDARGARSQGSRARGAPLIMLMPRADLKCLWAFCFLQKRTKTLASLLGGHRVRDSRHPGEQEGEGSG